MTQRVTVRLFTDSDVVCTYFYYLEQSEQVTYFSKIDKNQSLIIELDY